MSVYVGTRIYRYGRMKMSHMGADTMEELHKMADLIGVDRKHFQNKKNRPHYDVCQKMKLKAIENGALEVNDRKLIQIYRKIYEDQE